MPSSDRRLRLPRALAALVVAAALTGLSTAPAAAHDELTGSTPTDGAVLDTAPEQIELSFSAEPLELGSQVQVTDSTGASVTDGDLEIDGTRLIQPLTDTAPQGESYQVIWRAVSNDGHPIEGTFTYQVGAGTAPSTSAATAPTDTPSAAADSAPATGPAGSALPWGVLGTGAVLVAALVRRRRS